MAAGAGRSALGRARLGDFRWDVTRHMVIRGRVQGVGYRAYTERIALERGIQGWVRKPPRRHGSKHCFAGPPDAVEAIIAACRQGPRGAHVERIDQREGTRDESALRRRGELFRCCRRF